MTQLNVQQRVEDEIKRTPLHSIDSKNHTHNFDAGSEGGHHHPRRPVSIDLHGSDPVRKPVPRFMIYGIASGISLGVSITMLVVLLLVI